MYQATTRATTCPTTSTTRTAATTAPGTRCASTAASATRPGPSGLARGGAELVSRTTASTVAFRTGPGETQEPEYFGPTCAAQHCPSGDDPMTARDETNCTGVLAKGGHGVGEPGNLCHVDCSNRGFCDHETGQCKCFQGFYGHNCHYKDALAVQIEI